MRAEALGKAMVDRRDGDVLLENAESALDARKALVALDHVQGREVAEDVRELHELAVECLLVGQGFAIELPDEADGPAGRRLHRNLQRVLPRGLVWLIPARTIKLHEGLGVQRRSSRAYRGRFITVCFVQKRCRLLEPRSWDAGANPERGRFVPHV